MNQVLKNTRVTNKKKSIIQKQTNQLYE